MNYCDNCHLLTIDTRCPKCRNKKLREPTNEDFCDFAFLGTMRSRMLEEALKKQKIENVSMPIRSNLNSVYPVSEPDYARIFVRFKDLKKAHEIYNAIFANKK